MAKKIKVVTQNCFLSIRTAKVVRLMQQTKADVFCLQEITRQKVAERIKKYTGLPYIISGRIRAFLHIRFHNAIFTKLPIRQQGELTFTKPLNTDNHFTGKALWITVKYQQRLIRIYNCYLNINRCGMKDRKDALLGIIKHSNNFEGPIIICGDMNTAISQKNYQRRLAKLIQRVPYPTFEEVGQYAYKSEKYLFYDTLQKSGFREVCDIEKNTWGFPLPFIRPAIFNLKLDWFLIKNFSDYSYRFGPFIGDHKSIITELTT